MTDEEHPSEINGNIHAFEKKIVVKSQDGKRYGKGMGLSTLTIEMSNLCKKAVCNGSCDS